jgi:hypothetical protein
MFASPVTYVLLSTTAPSRRWVGSCFSVETRRPSWNRPDIVVGALAGDDIGDNFVDRKDLSGPLLSVIAQIETFLRLHLRTGHEIVGFEKEKRERSRWRRCARRW